MNNTKIEDTLNFFELMEKWSLFFASRITKSEIQMYRNYDTQLNPYNEQPKPELRTETEIISDISMGKAWRLLYRRYGKGFQKWSYENDMIYDSVSKGSFY